MTSDKRREFRLTVDEDIALKRVATENGLPIATVIREAVNEYVNDYADGERRILR